MSLWQHITSEKKEKKKKSPLWTKCHLRKESWKRPPLNVFPLSLISMPQPLTFQPSNFPTFAKARRNTKVQTPHKKKKNWNHMALFLFGKCGHWVSVIKYYANHFDHQVFVFVFVRAFMGFQHKLWVYKMHHKSFLLMMLSMIQFWN